MQGYKATYDVTDFNPRPREEGDRCYGNCSCRSGNFNPRPREEGDLAAFARPLFSDISIHALVKRATQLSPLIVNPLCISIHALVKRATLFLDTSGLFLPDFNPRPREEGDS